MQNFYNRHFSNFSLIFWYFYVRKVSIIAFSHVNIRFTAVCMHCHFNSYFRRSFVSCITMKYKEQKTKMCLRIDYFEVMLALDILFSKFWKKSLFIFGCKYETWFSFGKLFYFSVFSVPCIVKISRFYANLMKFKLLILWHIVFCRMYVSFVIHVLIKFLEYFLVFLSFSSDFFCIAIASLKHHHVWLNAFLHWI